MTKTTHHPLDADRQGAGAADEGGERIAKALARAGVASRRDIERLIEEGRVAINGAVLTHPAVKVGPHDILTVDGEVVADAEPVRLFRYHKPVGLVTSHKDPQGRPTVFAALPEELPRLISVGRLDLNTEGLLLLTNDGELSRALELPSTGWVRRYRARAYGHADQAKLDKLKDGVTVEGVSYGAIEAKIDKANGANVWITLTLAEGKNREVRRVLESLGLKVNRLIRLSYGPFALSTLDAGQVEEVGPRVVREILEGVVPPERMPTGDKVRYVNRAPGARRRAAEDSDAVQEAKPAPVKGQAVSEDGRKIYKAGWAKPKKKAAPPHASKKAAAAKAEAKRSGKTFAAAPAKPGAAAVKPGTTRPTGGKPAGFKPGGPRPAGPRPAGPRPTGPRPSGAGKPRGR